MFQTRQNGIESNGISQRAMPGNVPSLHPPIKTCLTPSLQFTADSKALDELLTTLRCYMLKVTAPQITEGSGGNSS